MPEFPFAIILGYLKHLQHLMSNSFLRQDYPVPDYALQLKKNTFRAVAMVCVIPEVAVTVVLVITAIVFYRVCATV